MTPAARNQAAIEILEGWAPGRPMDRLLTGWGRAHRFAGSGDRAAIADLVYDALRRWRSLGWPEGAGAEGARARLLALAAEAGAVEAVFSGARHAPAPPTEAERAWLARREGELAGAPEAVRLDVPDWLLPEFRASLGARTAAVLEALRGRAPVDLRVNRLKGDAAAAREALAEAGVETEPAPLAPDGLRVTAGARALRRAAPLLDGRVEVQDAASQAVAAFACARPGERALDFCAGGGGKALALAAEMGGAGEVVAHDAAPARMADLPGRAAREGAAIRVLPGAVPEAGRFDLVFADAPCSGSGAWRRNPDAKWALTPEGLARMTGLQAQVLDAAARFVRPGGRLVYATCSLLEAENGAAAAAFAARGGPEPAEVLRLTPLEGGDGFFAARFDFL
jgi:16S rRNA (cytosine967-C5)-methyltransferase